MAIQPRAATQVGQHPRRLLPSPRVDDALRVAPASGLIRQSGASMGYGDWLEKEPVLTKAATSIVLSTLSSTVAQVMSGGGTLDMASVLLNALSFGWTKAPPYSHFWYPVLASINSNPLFRVVLDQVFWRPLLTAYTFAIMCVVQGKSPEQTKDKFRGDYWKTVKAGLRIWPLAEAINQGFVPLKWRSLFKDVVGFGWDIKLALDVGSSSAPAQFAPGARAAPGAGEEALEEKGEAKEELAGCPVDKEGVPEPPPATPKGGLSPAVPFTLAVLVAMYISDHSKRRPGR
mmetsp:Transcript_2043/g.4345  ORF Transcript_2043/g.4345 Transcript_2043/m.4345 type:complete len:288 (-) Transcript_2043:250-1113(-)